MVTGGKERGRDALGQGWVLGMQLERPLNTPHVLVTDWESSPALVRFCPDFLPLAKQHCLALAVRWLFGSI